MLAHRHTQQRRTHTHTHTEHRHGRDTGSHSTHTHTAHTHIYTICTDTNYTDNRDGCQHEPHVVPLPIRCQLKHDGRKRAAGSFCDWLLVLADEEAAPQRGG